MYPIPWYAIILIAIPQTFLIISIGAYLFNINIPVQKRIIVSIIIGVVCYFTRYLTIPAMNTIALIVSTTVLLSLISRLIIWKAFLTIGLGLAVLLIIENLCNSIVFNLFHLNYDILAAHPWLNIFSWWPTLVVAILVYWLIYRNKWVLYNLSQYKDNA